MQNIPINLPDRLIEEGLSILFGAAREVSEEYVKQIIEKSRQPHVMKFEGHEDTEGRFKDIDTYREWAKKDRIVYLLINPKTSDVGGILWFGEKTNELIDPSYNLTFGIRLYEGYVGKGLSKPFMQATHNDAKRFYPRHRLWLDFAKDNIAAQKAYQSFGYKELARTESRVVMGYTGE